MSGCHGALMIITQLEQASSYVGSIACRLPRSARRSFLWLKNVCVDAQTFSTKTVRIFPTSRKSVRIFGPMSMFSKVLMVLQATTRKHVEFNNGQQVALGWCRWL